MGLFDAMRNILHPHNEKLAEEVNLTLVSTVEDSGEPISIGTMSLPAHHNPNDPHCYCISCMHALLQSIGEKFNA